MKTKTRRVTPPQPRTARDRRPPPLPRKSDHKEMLFFEGPERGPVPLLPYDDLGNIRVADGERVLSIEQAAARWSDTWSADDLAWLWHDAFPRGAATPVRAHVLLAKMVAETFERSPTEDWRGCYDLARRLAGMSSATPPSETSAAVAACHVLFEDVGGSPVARLPHRRDGTKREPDGVTIFTLEQAAAHWPYMSHKELVEEWEIALGELADGGGATKQRERR